MEFSSAPIRLARPTGDLARAHRFWVDGLGLTVLWRGGADAEGGHALLMVGPSGGAWHLELVHDPVSHAAARPTAEDLLVLYLGAEPDPMLVDRLVRHGGRRVTSPNPYWERWGVTIEDPDGYRLVLSSRSWP